MPFGDRLQNVVGVVAIRAGEQLAHVDQHDLMPGPVGDEHAFQAHMVVP